MHRRKDNNSNLVIYVLAFILISYLFIRFGLRLFVDLAFFIKQGGNTDNTEQTTKNNKITIITEPELNDVPNATSEAVLKLNGQGDPDTKMALYHNGKRTDTTNSDFEGMFSFEVTMSEKENDFYVAGKNSYSDKTVKSRVYEVIYLNKPPELEITNVSDGQRVYNSDLTIEGKTDKEVFVYVNSVPIVVKADGTFSHRYSLKKGENKIEVAAEDVAGNRTTKNITINYEE